MDIKHYQVENTLVCTFVPPRHAQAHTCVPIDLGATKLSDLFRTSQLNDSVWEIRLLSWTVLLLFPHGGLVSVWQWPCAKYSRLFWPLLICFFKHSFLFFFHSSTLPTMPCYISIQTPAKVTLTQCHLLSPYFAGFELWGVGVVFGWRWGQCDAVYPPYMVNILKKLCPRAEPRADTFTCVCLLLFDWHVIRGVNVKICCCNSCSACVSVFVHVFLSWGMRAGSVCVCVIGIKVSGPPLYGQSVEQKFQLGVNSTH